MLITNFPQQLGKYRIDSQLGQGAMGVVYKAFDTEIEREVAIKILHDHVLSGDMGEELVRRFAHEVKAAARCQHPNIVTVYDYGVSKNQPYMVMEYVKGIDLQIFLKSTQTLTTEQSVNLILKVLDALQCAHSMGVVHRDIKPANIILLDNGQIKVTDFGVARIDSSDLTQVGDVMGTPSYMSPEARSGLSVTASSDLYATALVLLEILINKRVNNKNIDHSSIVALLEARDVSPLLISKFAEVITKALQPDPQQRYADALSFSKALATLLETGLDYYQLTNDLAATVLIVKSTFQKATSQDNTDSLLQSAISSLVLQSQLSLIEKNLTHYLGPVAKMLVKKQAKNTDNLNQLINSLVTHIPSEIDRQNFRYSLDFSTHDKSDELIGHRSNLSKTRESENPLFSTDYIERLTADLTQYLGPVAKHVMKSTLKKVNTKEALCSCLADKIPNLKERTEFLKNRNYSE